MVDLKSVRLVLFFTQGMSLQAWEQGGLFEREVALYRRLRPHLGGIVFISYGDASDLEFASRLEGIKIVCNRWKLPMRWYRRYLTYVPAGWKWGKIVFKSNQVRGGDFALSLARYVGKPFIARCGYLLSDHMQWREGVDAPLARQSLDLEEGIFAGASQVVVTTEAMRQSVFDRYGIGSDKVRVIPNYVDTQLFSPATTLAPPNRLIFVGRLEPQKNIFSLVEALAGLDVELWMVGEGSLREQIAAQAQLLGVVIRFFGVVPHAQLPGLLHQCALFVLPSLWEGHPKTLLEAMSCGMPVIAGEIPALRGVVFHRENGFFCGLSPDAIRAAVLEVMGNADLRAELGKNARKYALEHLTLQSIVTKELAMLQELVHACT